MEDTYKYFIGAVTLFFIFISVLTVILGTVRWLVERYGWWARIGITALVVFLGFLGYMKFEEVFMLILEKVQ